MKKLKPIHWTAIATATVIAVPGLWFAMAYAGLPHLWSHHEHKLMANRNEIISYTAQDIPADPVNLMLKGSEAAIGCAFARAGWSRAENVSVRTGLKIGASVVFGQPYPDAPVSPLYLKDHSEDFAFERAEGRSADKRHHVRFWRIGDNKWFGAATFDRGVGVSLFTLQITHHIGPDVDRERAMIDALIVASGGRIEGNMVSRIAAGKWHRNGGGDRYRTDGAIAVLDLDEGCKTG